MAHMNVESFFLLLIFVKDCGFYHGMKITMKRSHHRPFKGVNVLKEPFLQTSNDKQIIQVPKVITSFSLKIYSLKLDGLKMDGMFV